MSANASATRSDPPLEREDARADGDAARQVAPPGEGGEAANEPHENGTKGTGGNLIKRSVDEICALMKDVHDTRETLRSRGVAFHMLNAMIELGMQNKPEEQEQMLETAVAASKKAHGPLGLEPDELREHVDALVALEKDLLHIRTLAAQQGANMQALNHLTQLMWHNPGDGGTQAINTLVAYADAAGVPLDQVAGILERFRDEPSSVLPQIPRESGDDPRRTLHELGKNVLTGVVLTVVVMWLIL